MHNLVSLARFIGYCILNSEFLEFNSVWQVRCTLVLSIRLSTGRLGWAAVPFVAGNSTLIDDLTPGGTC